MAAICGVLAQIAMLPWGVCVCVCAANPNSRMSDTLCQHDLKIAISQILGTNQNTFSSSMYVYM